jgi:hypothetical protein
MMGTLNITSWGLLVGAMGQAFFYKSLFPHLSGWVVVCTLFVPWFTVFAISFCNRPPCGPRPFRRCLIFSMVWYSAMTVLVEVLRFCLKPSDETIPAIVLRVLMYLFGSASFTVLIRICFILREYETGEMTNAVMSNDERNLKSQ